MNKKFHLLPLTSDIIQYSAELILKEVNAHSPINSPVDLSNGIVVFPTRRIQHFLLHHLTQKIGKNFIAPSMFTIDDFFSFLFEQHLPGLKKANDTEAAFYLFNTIRDRYPDILSYLSTNTSIDNVNFLEFFQWSLTILSAVESIYSEAALFDPFSNNTHNTTTPGLNEEAYREFVRMGDYHREYKELIINLPSLARDFKVYMERNGHFTRGIAYRTISTKAKEKTLKLPEGRYFFIGFHSPNYCEKILLKEITETRETHIILKTDPGALQDPKSPFYLQHKFIEELGYKESRQEERSPIWNRFSKTVTLVSTPDTETEMLKISQLLNKNLSSYSKNNLKRIAIVLPEPASLIPTIHGIVSRTEDIPFNISLQYPFRRTPLFQLIENILQLNINRNEDGFRCEDYLQIIRHPYVKMLDTSDEEYLKRAIHKLENIITSNNIVRTEQEELEKLLMLDPQENNENLPEEIRKINEAFVIPKEKKTLLETVTFLIEAIKTIEKLKERYPFLGEYLYLFFNVMEELRKISSFEGLHEIESNFKLVANFIMHHLSRKAVPFEGSPLKGIQIIGMLETRGLNFDEVYIPDAIEGILPEERKYDPILPYDIKKIFGIRSHTDWEFLFAYNLFSLIGSSKKTYILYPNKKNGQIVPKSRYVEYITYSIEKELKHAPQIEGVNYKLNLSRGEPQSIRKDDTTLEKLFKLEYSPSSIQLFLHCPKQFYYSKVLGLEEHLGISEEIDGGTWGSMVHEILREIFKIFITHHNGKPQKLREDTIQEIIHNVFKKYGTNPKHGLTKLHSWYMNLQITAFINKQLEENDALTVKYLEKTLSTRLSILNRGVKIKGRIDRIDEITEQERVITTVIDYKTGTNFRNVRESTLLVTLDRLLEMLEAFETTPMKPEAKNELYEKTIKQLKSFQLLFYLYLFNKGEIEKNNSHLQGRYIYLGGTNKSDIRYMDVLEDPSVTNVSTILETFARLLTLILEDITNTELDFFQTNDTKTCEYCPFTNLCRF